MTLDHYTTGRKKFKHLTIAKRGQIEALLKLGVSKVEIAKQVGISRSTLYEELKRGTVDQLASDLKTHKKYFAETGQIIYEKHRKNSRKPYKLAKASKFVEYVEKEILNNKLSPDAVCGYAKKNHLFDNMVCTKTLYNYIQLSLIKVKNIDLPLRVRIKSKYRKSRKNRRILGESIENRPIIVNDRKEFAHWEIDTVVGVKESAPVFLTLDERVTRQRIIVKISSRSASAVNEGMRKIIEQYGDLAPKVFKSITSDNGSEFASLKEVIPFADIYYAHPYSSFERGTNEKQNSLLRRFFPKGKRIDDVSDEAILKVQNWINNLPRKIFNYSSSNDLFSEFMNNL